MKYIALLRGINVGGKNKVEMKRLRVFFESLGYKNVTSYLNSGNLIFESKIKPIQKQIESGLKKEFGFEIRLLMKTEREMRDIVGAIPNKWKNASEQRTDVAYLFDQINKETIIEDLPFNRQYIDVIFTKGALIWNVLRENVYKSRLGKLISHKYYQQMTMRNVNTARYLGRLK